MEQTKEDEGRILPVVEMETIGRHFKKIIRGVLYLYCPYKDVPIELSWWIAEDVCPGCGENIYHVTW
jgi:hypothetical protein